MNELQKPKNTQPKLMTKSKFLILLIALLIGVSLPIIQEYRAKGKVSGVIIFSCVITVIFGSIFLIVLKWYANKPEK